MRAYRIAAEVGRDFPDVSVDMESVDTTTVRMVKGPGSLDTIAATNLRPDILSALATALAGGIGFAPRRMRIPNPSSR